MSKYSHWTELAKSLPAMSIDPATEEAIAHHLLSPGTRIHNALVVLAEAEKDGSVQVVVEVKAEDGVTSFQRVSAAALRSAIQ